MRILQVQQGSAAWHAERARRFTASEAPAMMGASKYTSRPALLKQKATGLIEEVTPQKQALFDRGHATEAPARGIVEEKLGEELYPATAVHDTDDRLLASFDGVTMTEEVLFEHKLWSEDLAAQVRAGDLEPHYYWQLEHQLLVSGAERVIFVCSDGTRERFVHMEYRPVPGRREALLAGWKQFEVDLAAYVPPAAVEKIAAEPVESLPAPVVTVSGQITLQDNFKVFEAKLRHFLEHRLIREPKSDQDFADLDQQIKAMKQAREALKAAEAQMLAQVQPVDQAKKQKDMLDTLLQQNVSLAEGLLKGEKERRKGEIVAAGVKALADHTAALNQRLGERYMPQVPADFGGCVRGLKSLDSMEDKVATELARAKIAANEIADRIQINMQALVAAGDKASFPDAATLVLKAPDDLRAIIAGRVAETERKLEEQRARIRAEEEARAAAKVRQEQEAREAEARRQREEAVHAQARAEKEARDAEERREQAAFSESLRRELTPPPAAAAQSDHDRINEEGARRLFAEMPAADNVRPLPTKAPAAPSSPPSLRLGQICERLGFTVTADFLASLGFPVVATDKNAKLYRESDWHAICAAIAQHVVAVANGQRVAA